MARLTLTQIMTQVAATVNQEATAPSAGGSEYLLWLEYLNRAYFEWSQAMDWEVLRKIYVPAVTGISQATLPLPADFRKLAAPIKLYDGDTSIGTDFKEIMWEEEAIYSPNDKYVKTLGNMADGFSLLFNPATLASGASIVIQYYAMPTSLASPAVIPSTPDSQFLIDRTIAYIFESRSDSRFQLEENKARERLLTMIESENDRKFNSYAGSANVTTPERRAGFRIGRD